jgi:hypothetical protein
MNPDLNRYPMFKSATVLDVVLAPGELLFIPIGWWHWVQALDVSISLAFQSFAVPGHNVYWDSNIWIGPRPE